jgi:O-antigen ligase
MTPRAPPITGWLLCVLLAYATATVFIPAAWPVQSFHIAVFALLAVVTLLKPRNSEPPNSKPQSPAPELLFLPLWGLLQLLAGSTAVPANTRAEILHWAALAAVFFLARRIGADRPARHAFLTGFLGFSVTLAILCLLQLFTSEGRVLWIFPTGNPDVYGTFPSRNNYAQFIELALPVALWSALRDPRHAWAWSLSAGVLYASVIGSASRAGAVLCTAELVAFIALSFRKTFEGRPSRARVPVFGFLLVPLVVTLTVGWGSLLPRFLQPDPYLVRREYLEAAANMVRQRPIMGFGLGAFPTVAPAFAVKDFPFYANHVHNDWLEFAADGGILFAMVVLSLFVRRVPAILRHPWALGLLAVALHACVDYPFPRPAVSAWIFALLGLVASGTERTQNEKGRPRRSRPDAFPITNNPQATIQQQLLAGRRSVVRRGPDAEDGSRAPADHHAGDD